MSSEQHCSDVAEELQRILTALFLKICRTPDQLVAGNIPLAHLAILHTLFEHGPLRMSTLARSLRVTVPSTTITVGRLVHAGLVRRSPDSSDRRAVLVAITPLGRAVRSEALTVSVSPFRAPLKRLTTDERDLLRRALPCLERVVAHDELLVQDVR
jgi:DNA-binding MarR family transcriptional regulator